MDYLGGRTLGLLKDHSTQQHGDKEKGDHYHDTKENEIFSWRMLQEASNHMNKFLHFLETTWRCCDPNFSLRFFRNRDSKQNFQRYQSTRFTL